MRSGWPLPSERGHRRDRAEYRSVPVKPVGPNEAAPGETRRTEAGPGEAGPNVVQILTESLATSLRCGWCLLYLTRVKSGRACLPRQARQPRRPGRESFRARSTLKSVHWTDLTPLGRGRVSPRQARPDLQTARLRRIPCLPPCGVQQSGRAFPHRGTADPTLWPMSPYQCRQAVSVKPAKANRNMPGGGSVLVCLHSDSD